jgi:serine/threonine protein phosphatase PrpC
MPLWRGDRVLLCSDGLWGSLEDDDIVRILADRPMAGAVPELAEQAPCVPPARAATT